MKKYNMKVEMEKDGMVATKVGRKKGGREKE